MVLACGLLVLVSCRVGRGPSTVPVPAERRGDAALSLGSSAASANSEPRVRVRIARETDSAKLAAGDWVVAAEGSLAGSVLTGPLTAMSTRGGIKLI
ncbi:MAG: hypothetical protein AAGF47_11605, partial [Planctomycetota bacterium]